MHLSLLSSFLRSFLDNRRHTKWLYHRLGQLQFAYNPPIEVCLFVTLLLPPTRFHSMLTRRAYRRKAAPKNVGRDNEKRHRTNIQFQYFLLHRWLDCPSTCSLYQEHKYPVDKDRHYVFYPPWIRTNVFHLHLKNLLQNVLQQLIPAFQYDDIPNVPSIFFFSSYLTANFG